MKTYLRPALVLFVLLTLITGVAYPLLITGIAQAVFPAQANGSVVERGGKPVGSSLIGQTFSAPKYFWSRPSATSPMSNNGTASSGSNLGPTNPALIDAVQSRIDALQKADPANKQSIPIDLVTASASGLDPHISIASARYQASRIAKERSVPIEQVNALIERSQENASFGFIGEPRVNVLQLNLSLDSALNAPVRS
jgi:K+-transporting ATPase ATPase C chain